MRLIVLLLLAPFVLSTVPVDEFYDQIIKMQVNGEISVVVGRDSDPIDSISATKILLAMETELKGKFNTEVSENESLIIIGGPCANPLWTTYTSETCEDWSLREGESVTKVVDNVILIAGTTGKDTIKEVELFASDYQDILSDKTPKNSDSYIALNIFCNKYNNNFCDCAIRESTTKYSSECDLDNVTIYDYEPWRWCGYTDDGAPLNYIHYFVSDRVDAKLVNYIINEDIHICYDGCEDLNETECYHDETCQGNYSTVSCIPEHEDCEGDNIFESCYPITEQQLRKMQENKDECPEESWHYRSKYNLGWCPV